MKKWFGCGALAALVLAPSVASAGDLRLSIANGRVTLVAQDVTVKQILDEWQRVGQTVVVGADRLPGQPITIELNDVAEGRALESLLRAASGYIAKPRGNRPGASAYDQILIMPASRPPALSAAPPPFATRPQPQVIMPNVIDDDEPNPSVAPPGSVPPPFPGQPPMQPGAQPGMQPPPMTAPRPGQLPAPAAAPGFPGNPYQPNNPGVVRPPTVPGMPGGTPSGPGGGGER
jgi:hypothetical protein